MFLVALLYIMGLFELSACIGSRKFPAPVINFPANCNPTQRRAGLLCPCRLLPSTNGGVRIPCGVTGSYCLPFIPSLALLGISQTPDVGVCQCGPAFTRNAISNTCSLNLAIVITPVSAVVACSVLAGQNVATITVFGGTGPYTTSISVLSSGDFPGAPQNAPLYLEIDSNNQLSIVAVSAAPDSDITQCYTIQATDAASGLTAITFCALIETPNVCPRPPVISAIPSGPVFASETALEGQVAGQLVGSGGFGPYTFSALVVVSCSDSAADVNGCNPYLTLSADGSGALLAARATPAVLNSPVTQCFTATVKDFLRFEGTVLEFCAKIESYTGP